MLRLALTNETRRALIAARLATDEEIEADIAETMRLPEDTSLSVCMVAQVSGSK
jgi:hypothetical protein